ncbi:MAG TPA: formate dehydrogenase accessory sulfurtransferase FdhD [Jiangellaceae bacterium]|nr:formate dehydrogenase accessory sulfurtransferase FdhD [Jiangellaceae bacterium]
MGRSTRRPVVRWRAQAGEGGAAGQGHAVDDATTGSTTGSSTAAFTRRPDTLAVEEPLQIRVAEHVVGAEPSTLTVTMRTPGDDFDLVAGWLVAEGVVRRATDIEQMRFCADVAHRNTVEAFLAAGVRAPRTRAFATTSACGVCGSDTIDDVRHRRLVEPPPEGEPVLAASVLAALPERLRADQRVFDRTGGLHAAGVFDADGSPIEVREDVGRHNAVDKVVGALLKRDHLPLHDTVLQVSGRASFELVQKTAMAGIPVLAAVSAPSSLTTDLAEDAGITLVGFSRGTSMNIYTNPGRLARLPRSFYLPPDRSNSR